MSFRNGGVKLARRAAAQVDVPVAILPAFLCPGILEIGPAPRTPRCFHPRRPLHTTEASHKESEPSISRPLAFALELTLSSKLPVQCPGCGALSQVVEKDDPGFYTLTRGSVRGYFQGRTGSKGPREQRILEKCMDALEASEEATEKNKEIIGELSSVFAQTSGMC